MKRKRRIKTREVYKWKARLNVHGGMQTHGVNYWDTYAPVVTWPTIRLILILSLLFGWYTAQVDFVLAYPQADAECDLYLGIPRGFHISGTQAARAQVLKLLKNIYGQKQAGKVWNDYMNEKMVDALGYTRSEVDPCLYYHGKTLFVVYVDDGIFGGPDYEEIEELKARMSEVFEMTDEGDLSDYLGVNIDRKEDGSIEMTQPHLIDQLVEDVNFTSATGTKPTPALSSKTLQRDEELPDHKATWGYRSVIGKLNFLLQSTRPELAVSVHQCARFSVSPKITHTDAVHHVIKYLLGSRDKGLVFKPDLTKSFEVYCDADFCGLWNRETAMDDPSTAKSRTGFVILFAGCPLLWTSRLQTDTALSTTESEYISLSDALRETISMMRLLKEITQHDIVNIDAVPVVKCRLFGDNSGAVELAKVPKMRPRTKHINAKYHHFRKFVHDGLIKVFQVSTNDQLADIFTKNLGTDLFNKFRLLICGW
jgi:hypothetical protein